MKTSAFQMIKSEYPSLFTGYRAFEARLRKRSEYLAAKWNLLSKKMNIFSYNEGETFVLSPKDSIEHSDDYLTVSDIENNHGYIRALGNVLEK